MGKITMKDVAQKAGVSPSTVSLVLSGKGAFSDDVRDKVYNAARKLDYIKSLHTPSIAAKQISHIAILICEDYEKAFEWNFVRRMLISLEAEITKEHYYPVIVPVTLVQDSREIFEKIVLSKVGAILSIHYANTTLFKQLEQQGLPVVLINNHEYRDKFYTVCADVMDGAYKATKHLLNHGHRDIAMIDYYRNDMPTLMEDIFWGFKKALDEERVSQPEHYRLTVDLYNEEELYQKLKNLLKGTTSPPTALFAHDDYFAARIFSTLQRLGIQVPDAVSLTALGDTLDYQQPFIPKITTARLNNELLGKIAGEMILKRLKNEQSEQIDVLKVNYQLQDRNSCKHISK